jgi:hypothetical protein
VIVCGVRDALSCRTYPKVHREQPLRTSILVMLLVEKELAA